MKMFNLTCPHCGKAFYGDVTMVELKTPLHCPGCGAYMDYAEYRAILGSSNGTALARLKRPLTEENMDEVIYRPRS